MSVIVLVLNDGIDTVVWCSEELKGVIASIYAALGNTFNAKQNTARFLNGFQSRCDVVGQKPTAKPSWP
jgi:hypothetical protein